MHLPYLIREVIPHHISCGSSLSLNFCFRPNEPTDKMMITQLTQLSPLSQLVQLVQLTQLTVNNASNGADSDISMNKIQKAFHVQGNLYRDWFSVELIY